MTPACLYMYIRSYFSAALFLLCAIYNHAGFSQTAYRVGIRFTDTKYEKVYLAHFYGKHDVNHPTIFVIDSTVLDGNGNATFTGTDHSFVGGMYIILLGDKERTRFVILLNKGDNFSVTVSKGKLPNGITFQNSPENEQFESYNNYLKTASSSQIATYRRSFVKSHPNSLLASIFNAMEVPEKPSDFSANESSDNTLWYRYYKAHYWDKFNFHDDRLVYTPLYDDKISEYMHKLVISSVDSIEKEADALIASCKGTKDMMHYTLWWLVHDAENSKIAGMDEVFVYLVDNYYNKGYAFWLTDNELRKYTDRAQKISVNLSRKNRPTSASQQPFAYNSSGTQNTIPQDQRKSAPTTSPREQQTGRGADISNSGSEPDKISLTKIRNVALVIGTNQYTNWPALSNPVFDAETIKTELEQKYGYEVILLKNPSKAQIQEALLTLYKKFQSKAYGENANFLFFLAGHGGYDDFVNGYIVPSDAKSSSSDKFKESCIKHDDLRTMIDHISAKHTLVVLDACYGGTFDQVIAHRGSSDNSDDYPAISYSEFVTEKSPYSSRKYITSGGKEYVPDGTPGHHSPFAYRFIALLRDTYDHKRIITFHALYSGLELVKPQPRAGEFGYNDPNSDFILIPNSLTK
jgi:Caspase domain/Domain of unknown function (DUF5106)